MKIKLTNLDYFTLAAIPLYTLASSKDAISTAFSIFIAIAIVIIKHFSRRRSIQKITTLTNSA